MIDIVTASTRRAGLIRRGYTGGAAVSARRALRA